MMMRSRIYLETLLAAGAALCLGLQPAAGADTRLVKNGQAQATLVLPENASETLTTAASEIQTHILKMSGAELPIVVQAETAKAQGIPVYFGAAADPALDAAIREKGDDPGAFALVVKRGEIHVRGLSDEGTLFGAYELLEQLGVRWFMTGDFGTVIPDTKDVALARQTTVQVPSFRARWLGGGGARTGAWRERMRMGGPYFPSAHGCHLPKGYEFKERPDCYALIGGQRRKRQLCVSNPDVVKGAIETTRAYFRKSPGKPWIGIGPNDGRGFCECENCKALDGGDWDPFASHESMTDRYLWFFNQILAGIRDEFPDKKICFYSYAAYNRPPVKTTPDPKIVPAFAPITICRVHGIGNPVCPEKNTYYRWLIQEWGKIIPEVYDRGYWFNLADPGLLFPMVHRMRTQVPIAHEEGITGWRVETLVHWASESPSLYIAARLMWDHQADVDALMADFCEKFFGPGAAPMGLYFALINATLRDADFHTGCSFDMPNFYPREMREQAGKHLAAAAKAVGDDMYGRRVKGFRDAFDYTSAFIDMLEKRGAHDWAGAKAALERMDTLRDKLCSHDPPLVNPKYATSYMRRFFRPCTEQGTERALSKGEPVAGLGDLWEFKLDPTGVGDSLGWFNADLTGGNWTPLRTSSLSWSDQGLRHYKGEGWYRQRVSIADKWKGRKIFIWFGGVDEKARVWVNGKLVGESPGRAFVPFEMDATEAVLPGRENLVVAWISNKRLNEVGTGGITAPVMFWSPVEAEHEAEAGGEDVTPVEFK